MAANGEFEAAASAQHRLGIDRALARQLAELSCDSTAGPRALAAEHVETLFSRIAWARIVEPGDTVAGALIAALGPVTSLTLLLDQETAAGIHARLCEAAGEDALTRAALSRALERWRPRANYAASRGDVATAIAAGATVITPEDALWPPLLNDLGTHAPLVLWVRGQAELLSRPAVAIVGARACTGYGAAVTAEITEVLCTAGATIVSGAAYGVDAIAHRTALAVEAPTVAVLAGGVDRAYPASHKNLLDHIAATGAVCSEMVPGSAPTRWRFLQRNRAIAALAGAVIVTEAGIRSGSLNTAGHAASAGRALGAVPGPITSSASSGCHRLIRDYGAALISAPGDALELFGAEEPTTAPDPDSDRQLSLHRRLIDALPLRGSRTIAEIAARAGVSERDARAAFAELEVLGEAVRRDPSPSEGVEWALPKKG